MSWPLIMGRSCRRQMAIGARSRGRSIRGSTPSTIEPFNRRSYRGADSAANARRTVFRPTPSCRQIARIGNPSARYSRRISASPPRSTPPDHQEGPNSSVDTGYVFMRRRHNGTAATTRGPDQVGAVAGRTDPPQSPEPGFAGRGALVPLVLVLRVPGQLRDGELCCSIVRVAEFTPDPRRSRPRCPTASRRSCPGA